MMTTAVYWKLMMGENGCEGCQHWNGSKTSVPCDRFDKGNPEGEELGCRERRNKE